MARRLLSQEYITTAARLLGILSHETRLNLVLALAQGEASVTELCEHLSLSQSNASHHLSILRNTGLVCDARDGQFVIYRLNLDAWRALGDGFFDQLLGGLDGVRLQHFSIRRISE
ncbi:MAG TPA: metalloregulator ArsR/SmtB family transcription factor [Gemmatimonadales bacterium]|nr:metalloregulator ArsR/SmtB family transcription factor [Gemmatimonadales bacterium]